MEKDKIYQISRHAAANISCLVDAQPSNVTFRWQFNNSGGIIDLLGENIYTKDTLSILNYNPENEGDYGLILCDAENIIGRQESPCIFNVSAASKYEYIPMSISSLK